MTKLIVAFCESGPSYFDTQSNGRDMAQVSRLSLTAVASIQSCLCSVHVHLRLVVGSVPLGQLSQSTSVHPCQYYFTDTPYSFYLNNTLITSKGGLSLSMLFRISCVLSHCETSDGMCIMYSHLALWVLERKRCIHSFWTIQLTRDSD
jgi:hypothetical protein